MTKDSENSKNEMFFDTSILVYAYTASDKEKTEIAKNLVKKVFNGEIIGCISNQVLAELSYVLLEKFNGKIQDIDIIIQSLVSNVNWIKVNYDEKTVMRSVQILKSLTTSFFDVLISETMKENGINKIVTENERDFNKIPGIKIINPFK